MSEQITFGELDFQIVSSLDERQAMPDRETPFRIALLGDFRGRSSRENATWVKLQPINVDRDNLDQVFAKLEVEVHLSLAEDNKALVSYTSVPAEENSFQLPLTSAHISNLTGECYFSARYLSVSSTHSSPNLGLSSSICTASNRSPPLPHP